MDDNIAKLAFDLLQALKPVTGLSTTSVSTLDCVHDECISLLTEYGYCIDCGAEGHEYADDTNPQCIN